MSSDLAEESSQSSSKQSNSYSSHQQISSSTTTFHKFDHKFWSACSDASESSSKGVSVFLLRHEDRHPKGDFLCSLTPKGLHRASTVLVDDLLKVQGGFDAIYSSPFLRTLQTIAPYCLVKNQKVILTNGLYECVRHTNIHPVIYRGDEDVTIHPTIRSQTREKFNWMIEKEDPNLQYDIKVGESIPELRERIIKFLKDIFHKHNGKSQQILLVSHQSTLELIYQCFPNPVDHIVDPGRDRKHLNWLNMGEIVSCWQCRPDPSPKAIAKFSNERSSKTKSNINPDGTLRTAKAERGGDNKKKVNNAKKKEKKKSKTKTKSELNAVSGPAAAIRIVTQRCSYASLLMDNVDQYASLPKGGLIIMISFFKGCSEKRVKEVAEKIVNVKVASLANWDKATKGGATSILSLIEKRKSEEECPDLPGIMIVPQAALLCKLKGRSAQYRDQMPPEDGAKLYKIFCDTVRGTVAKKVKDAMVVTGTWGNRQGLKMESPQGPNTHVINFNN
eukprot:g336.t1